MKNTKYNEIVFEKIFTNEALGYSIEKGYSTVEINLEYSDDYFYFLNSNNMYIYNMLDDNGNLEKFGCMIKWKGNSFKIRVEPLKTDTKIFISIVKKTDVYDTLDTQRSQNDVSVDFDHYVFTVKGTKIKGQNAYVTLPYTYDKNFKINDQYIEIINGNGEHITPILDET